MIIYGWNSKILKHAPLENVECEHCHEKSSQIGIISNYFHVFWIPLFPYSKKATIVCNHCSHVTSEKQMSPDFKAKVSALKAAVPTPKYLFAGVGIIAALVVFFQVNSYYAEYEQQNFLQEPLAGDIYILKDNDESSAYKYYLLKLKNIEEDTLLVTYNSLFYNGIPDKLEPRDGFYDFAVRIAKSDIATMDGKGEIQKVIRDYGDNEGYNRTVEYVMEEEVNADAGIIVDEEEEMAGNR